MELSPSLTSWFLLVLGGIVGSCGAYFFPQAIRDNNSTLFRQAGLAALFSEATTAHFFIQDLFLTALFVVVGASIMSVGFLRGRSRLERDT